MRPQFHSTMRPTPFPQSYRVHFVVQVGLTREVTSLVAGAVDTGGAIQRVRDAMTMRGVELICIIGVEKA